MINFWKFFSKLLQLFKFLLPCHVAQDLIKLFWKWDGLWQQQVEKTQFDSVSLKGGTKRKDRCTVRKRLFASWIPIVFGQILTLALKLSRKKVATLQRSNSSGALFFPRLLSEEDHTTTWREKNRQLFLIYSIVLFPSKDVPLSLNRGQTYKKEDKTLLSVVSFQMNHFQNRFL